MMPPEYVELMKPFKEELLAHLRTIPQISPFAMNYAKLRLSQDVLFTVDNRRSFVVFVASLTQSKYI